MLQKFDDWTGGRDTASLGTNAGSQTLAFQGWRNFKEAFAPELIKRAVDESEIPVRSCVDPFGGSGTTALACQFLGISPTTIEVNPYLADLIRAKLAQYDIASLVKDYATVVKTASSLRGSPRSRWLEAPPSFIEPGLEERYLFSQKVAARLAAHCEAIDAVANAINRRLLRVLLASMAVSVSNVIVSGKGRRYRRSWTERTIDARKVDELFSQSFLAALGDIKKYQNRLCASHRVICGDSRKLVRLTKDIDLAVLSPPYPNSFDYTDVYNVELWIGGYLDSRAGNRQLRESTLSSHVQILRTFREAPKGSSSLTRSLNQLKKQRSGMWNRNIPEMVGGYFADMKLILKGLQQSVRSNGRVYVVVGDSRYAGVFVRTGKVLEQLAKSVGMQVIGREQFRSMRTSAQQGGDTHLDEELLILRNA